MFRTSDIVLAATLRSMDCEIEDIEVTGNRGIFVFSQVDSDILDQFDMGQIRIEPNKFHQTVKQLTTAVRRKMG